MRDILESRKVSSVLLVAGPRSYQETGAAKVLEPLLEGRHVERFQRRDPYPTLEDIERGREVLRRSRPELIIAVGGGAVLDVAKAMRVPFRVVDRHGRTALVVDGPPPIVPLVAVPTTAGTGAETTRFAVVYVDGRKHSLDHAAVMPDHAIVDPSLTDSLDARETAITGLDALAQAIESIWSVASTDHSQRYAVRAARLALACLEEAALRPSSRARAAMSLAAHLSGRAIDQTRTTACHAASYPMTARYGIPHGHAVALTLPAMLVFNAGVGDRDVVDPRGVAVVRRRIATILTLLGVREPEAGRRRLLDLMQRLSLETSLEELGIRDVDVILAEGLSPERAGNNPRRITRQDLREMLLGAG